MDSTGVVVAGLPDSSTMNTIVPMATVLICLTMTIIVGLH